MTERQNIFSGAKKNASISGWRRAEALKPRGGKRAIIQKTPIGVKKI